MNKLLFPRFLTEARSLLREAETNGAIFIVQSFLHTLPIPYRQKEPHLPFGKHNLREIHEGQKSKIRKRSPFHLGCIVGLETQIQQRSLKH